jgi:hypothetical protein
VKQFTEHDGVDGFSPAPRVWVRTSLSCTAGAEDRYEQLPRLAAELIRSNVDVIATYGRPGAFAAKQATTTIPIVVASIGDAVVGGIVASVARPGGNVTGQSFFHPELSVKRIELLKTLLPQMTQRALASPYSCAPSGWKRASAMRWCFAIALQRWSLSS